MFDRIASLVCQTLFSFGFLVCSTSLSQGHNGAVVGAYPIEGITIDGNLDDWPKHAVAVSTNGIVRGDKPTSLDDLNCRFRVGYSTSDNALYVAIEVTDDSLVVDPSFEGAWDAQDGCSIYIDRRPHRDASAVEQYSKCGESIRVQGFNTRASNVEVKTARSEGGCVYEWCIHLPGETLSAGRLLGFDLDVADKDADGSFTWLAWGNGAQKAYFPWRIGDLFLLSNGDDLKLGRVRGKVVLNKDEFVGKDQFPRVLVQSTTAPRIWAHVECDQSGEYSAKLLEGNYRITPVDALDLRVAETEYVTCNVRAGEVVEAPSLQVSKLSKPDLGRTEGALQSGAFDPRAFDRFLRVHMQYYKIPGMSIAVVKDGRVIYHDALGYKNAFTKEPVTTDTLFEAGSMTKVVFAYAVNRLVERGVLDLDVPLYEYWPEVLDKFPDDERYKLITARYVLAHRTGLTNWDGYELQFTPGTNFGYSGQAFEWLAMVVSQITNKSIAEVVHDEVFVPLGIENAYLTWEEDSDYAARTASGHRQGNAPISKTIDAEPFMAYSLHTDALNYAKLLVGIMERDGLEETTFKEMLRRQFEIVDASNPEELPYGLGIVVEETSHGLKLSHGGTRTGFTSNMVLYDGLRAGYVFLINNEQAYYLDKDIDAYLTSGNSR